MTDWGGQRSRIGVVSLEECLNVINCFVSSIYNIYVRCRDVDEVIGSSISNLLTKFLCLEVQCLRVKGYRIHDIGDGLTGIVDDSVEDCVQV